jgi:hypothetical protein
MAQMAMIAGLGVMCLSSSVGAALMMGGGDGDAPSAGDGGGGGGAGGGAGGDDSGESPESYTDWTEEEGVDYPGNDIFHYHPNSTITASKEVCLDKCEEMSNCKLVTFNNDKTLCWGKTEAENKRDHSDRNNYFKP